jgi:ribosomal protein S12 methylthiotransferase accessory factor
MDADAVKRTDGPRPASGAFARAVAPGLGTSLPKQSRAGTHRARAPEATLRAITPRMAEFGVTRLGRLTGLDRLGIEVTMATRPNARGASVTNGKGLTTTAARVSALMEAIERWHAEHAAPRLAFGLVEDVGTAGMPARLDGLPRRPGAAADPGPIFWAEAVELISGGAAWVPFDLVHTNWLETVPDNGFHTSTNGLASGNHPVEATLHALCEVIERDSCGLFEHLPTAQRARRRLDPDSIDVAAVRDLIGRVAAAEFRLALWDATSEIGVPVILAALHDTRAPETPAGFGAGCHPDPGVAALRAITEAAQTRLIAITGTREDLGPEIFAGVTGLRFRWATRDTDAPRRDWSALPRLATDCVRADLRAVVAATARATDAVYAVDLSRGPGISVVRVIVPGFETGATAEEVTPGPRAARAPEHFT